MRLANILSILLSGTQQHRYMLLTYRFKIHSQQRDEGERKEKKIKQESRQRMVSIKKCRHTNIRKSHQSDVNFLRLFDARYLCAPLGGNNARGRAL